MPPNGPGNGRPESSTLVGRVRSLNVFASGASTASPSSDGANDKSASTAPQSRRAEPLGEDIIQSLGCNHGLEGRMSRLTELSSDYHLLDTSTLFAILDMVSDLTQASAPFAARKVVFLLLQICATRHDLQPDQLRRMSLLILEPVDSLGLESQLKALENLTHKGASIGETFALQFVDFLLGTLKSQTSSVFEARRKARNETEINRARDVPREKGLHALLDLTSKSVSFSPHVFVAASLDILVDRLLLIAERTTSKTDMRKVAAALGAVIRAHSLPDNHLKRCVEVSCAILNAMPDLKDCFWEDVLLLLSMKRDAVVDVLFEILALAPDDKHSHAVCGAISVLHSLIENQGVKGLPRVSFPKFIDQLSEIHFASRRPRRETLRSIRTLLEDALIIDEILAADWRNMISLISSASQDEPFVLTTNVSLTSRSTNDPSTQKSSPGQALQGPVHDELLEQLEGISVALTHLWARTNEEQRACVADFHQQFKAHLPVSSLQSLIDVSVKENLQILEDEARIQKQIETLKLFVLGRDADTAICQTIFTAIKTSLPHIHSTRNMEDLTTMIASLLEEFSTRAGDVRAINDLVGLAAALWKTFRPSSFDYCLDLIWQIIQNSEGLFEVPQGGTPSTAREPDNIVTEHLVEVFIGCLAICAPETVSLYALLLRIAKQKTLSARQRLPALALLTRLRSDAQGTIVLSWNGSQTGKSPQGHLGSETPAEDRDLLQWARDSSDYKPGVMKASEWLLVVLEVLQQSTDWRVLNYIWTHLPSQLSNLTLFSYAIPHIKHLRNVITSQLKNGTFQDNQELSDTKHRSSQLGSGAPDIKRGSADASLVQILTMLLGYTAHFSAGENDDIARTLLSALGGSKAAKKNAIYALATCCYIIPRCLTRSLPGILQKMSQTVTQSDLAVDILEFLGGLARLPEIYVNFREDEYRTVFAICVRYLEHSREKRLTLVTADAASADYTSNRLSEVSLRSSSTPTQDTSHETDGQGGLPQYVFALAYHVLTIWFLSLKLTDRSNFVGWITKNLAWTDQSGIERMEEQSQVALDMMHRTAYLDLGETEPRTQFSESDGQVLRKTWLVGLSLCTVETAVRTGLTKLIKRQASGTTYATYQQNTAPLPPHHAPPPTDVLEALSGPEARISIFPNHVFLQLMSNIAPMPAPLEPICLPDDEPTKRAISTFDRMDTVDGYRVGKSRPSYCIVYSGLTGICYQALFTLAMRSCAKLKF